MKTPFFTGVCTAMVTPSLEGKVNYPMAEQLLRRQMEAGIKTVVMGGTTGEAPTLSDGEKLELFRRARQYTGNRCKIIAGTGSNDTAHAVALSMAAEETGVDGLLVVTPYYNKATPQGLLAHYLAISQAVTIPIIIYNVPSRTSVDISVDVCSQLAQLPNIVGIKEASTDITKITKILRSCGNDITVWSGNDDMTVPMMAMGAKVNLITPRSAAT
jgi:4-hydroxy-tetrahydrodipicolinate synthase